MARITSRKKSKSDGNDDSNNSKKFGNEPFPRADDFAAFYRQMSSCQSSMRNLNRKSRMAAAARWIAYLLVIGDAWFSYWALRSGEVTGDGLAFFLAIAIGAVQWSVATAIFDRTSKNIFQIDTDDDGKVSIGEWFRFGIVVVGVLAVYVTDAATNAAGIDMQGAGTVILRAFSPNPPAWASYASTWIIAVFMMMADEMIHTFVDPIQRQIDIERPLVRRQYALLQAREKEVVAYRQALMDRATEAGRRRGENEEI